MASLIFSTQSKFSSAVIRWFTRSKCSHVSVGVELCGVPMIIEAAAGGVRIVPRAKWDREHRVVAEFTALPDLSKGLAWALEDIGERFDYVGLFGYMFVVIARWCGHKWRNPLASPRARWCSEFAIATVQHSGSMPEWSALDPEAVTPQELMDICRDSRHFQLTH